MENIQNESELTNDSNVPDFSGKTWKEDVVLLVEGKELYAAKNVLAYISPVFEAMFSHPFSEKDKSKVELPGKKYETFLEFMRCIYPGSERSITEENVFQVLPLADEYQVKTLMTKCEIFLRQFIGKKTTSTQDILKCLAVSERYHMAEIKDICVDKIERMKSLEIVEAEIEPICKDTMFEVMKRFVTREHLELVKHYILNGINEAVGETEFEGFTDAKGAVIDFVSKDVSKRQTSSTGVIHSSPVVDFWNFKFRAFVKYERENNKTKFGIFLEVDPPDNVSESWSVKVKGRLILRNSRSEDLSRQIDHTFTEDESDWGWRSFAELSEVLDPSKGYIVGDKVRIAAVFLASKPEAND
ncbi:kelch-like protein 28 [Mercenaria mercenaria]|uniref:kelch-like protein 28 n=1 Tax=Mercenaria mercenaria TaxID=6596 RepID=UPI00234F7A31|nr:kelch-like protein 28 [Mercenaria mercenaria]